ncbi:MAG: hypothetical protein KDD53_02570 [Bdellovibrionales bacterium]|nr:hypothetical protein [Bdellovibrionales bacterium]
MLNSSTGYFPGDPRQTAKFVYNALWIGREMDNPQILSNGVKPLGFISYYIYKQYEDPAVNGVMGSGYPTNVGWSSYVYQPKTDEVELWNTFTEFPECSVFTVNKRCWKAFVMKYALDATLLISNMLPQGSPLQEAARTRFLQAANTVAKYAISESGKEYFVVSAYLPHETNGLGWGVDHSFMYWLAEAMLIDPDNDALYLQALLLQLQQHLENNSGKTWDIEGLRFDPYVRAGLAKLNTYVKLVGQGE